MDSQAGQVAVRPPIRVGIAARALVVLVRLYQVSLGLVMGGHCRFHPSCSEYSVEALRTYGAFKGLWLTLRRISRCHPLGGHGFDPVPPPAGASSGLDLSGSSETITRR